MIKKHIAAIALLFVAIAALANAGDRVPLVVVSGRTTQAGSGDTLVVDQLRLSLVQAGTLATDPLRFNDWSPTGLGTKTVFEIQPGDNTGNWVTGIDAIGSSIPLGARITVCNANGPQDAGVVQFTPEDSSSLANNRLWIPGYGRNTSQTTYNAFALGPSSCVDLIYMQPNQADPTTKRWLFIGGDSRKSLLVAKQIGLYPYSFPAAITSGTTVNDYDGLDTCPLSGYISGIRDGRCEAGADPHQTSYTLVNLSTTGAGAVTVTGLKYSPSGSQAAEGQGPVKVLCNYGPGDIKLTNNDGGSLSLDQFNISSAGNQADVVLSSGKCAMFHHIRDIGKWNPLTKIDYLFDARDVTMTKGLQVSGVDASAGVANTTLMVDQVATGRTINAQNAYIRDVGSYDATAAGLTAQGMTISQSATRSAGANTLTNIALTLVGQNGQTNYALQTQGGNEYHGLGGAMTLFYNNTALYDVSGATKLGGNLQVGGDDFNAGAVKFAVNWTTGHVITGGPAVTFTTASCTSTNCTDYAGTVTSSSTSMTITFAATYTGASDATCIILPQGTATMPVCSESATAITCSTVVNATKYNYQCIGHQ